MRPESRLEAASNLSNEKRREQWDGTKRRGKAKR
jgi:hypothetical protein